MNHYVDNDYLDYLAHHGILGMKWGIRRYQPYSTHPRKSGKKGRETGEAARHRKRVSKQATKDAKRYADAKMFYGEGAGTQRKLIKAELSEKMKDPEYKKAFDNALNGVDYSKSAKRAKSKRRRKDTAHRARVTLHKTEKALGVTAVGVAATYYAANHERINAAISGAFNNYKTRAAAKAFLRRQGLI